jgi:hypothetical protein
MVHEHEPGSQWNPWRDASRAGRLVDLTAGYGRRVGSLPFVGLRTSRKAVWFLFFICVAVCVSPQPSSARSNPYVASIARYLRAHGWTADVAGFRIGHVASANSCAYRHPCDGRTAYLVTFSEGDGGGQALMFSSPTSARHTSLTTVVSGGGVIGARGLSTYGLDPKEARDLVSH